MLIDPAILAQNEILDEAERLLAEAGKDINKRADAIDQIAQTLYAIGDEGTIDLFVDEICSKHRIKKKVFTAKLERLARQNKPVVNGSFNPAELPEGVGLEAYEKGWFKHNQCYMFITKDGLFKASNYVVTPLYHIYSKKDNKRIIRLTNEFGVSKILDVPSRIMTSPDQFQGLIFGEGNYIFFGSRFHFYRILEDYSRNFPVANELRTLGWQREGFYAFANGIYADKWTPVDDLGVAEYNKQLYFSPSFSSIYADVREDDDDYENDRFFIYKPPPPDFSLYRWTELMLLVYGQKARIAIAFTIACIFRDIIYERYKIFPLLFLFGDKGTGKSQLAWSLSNIFFDNMPGFNLNSGTQVGFFRRLSRVKNAICWYDEYTNDIDEKRFQAIKASYDGLGHEKGEKSQDNRTTVTKINSGIMVSGQYLPNRDSNALFSRSILLSFEPKNYTKEETDNYDNLKKLEEDGLSGILPEILRHRTTIIKDYAHRFTTIFEDIKDYMLKNDYAFDERLIRNFACILTPIKILEETKTLAFTFQELYDDSITQILDMTRQIASSESVSTFWAMIEFLLDEGRIAEGIDFKIENVTQIKGLTLKSGETTDKTFNEPRELLFIRFGKIHPLYMEAHRRQYGKNGIELVSLTHYLKHHKAFVGTVKTTRFNTTNTSAFVFDHKTLNKILTRIYHVTTNDDPTTSSTDAIHRVSSHDHASNQPQQQQFTYNPNIKPPY